MFWNRKQNKNGGADPLKEYNGFQVQCHVQAKLVPWGDSKPDCVCELLLTELYLYVLQDNYNNTYTEHYIIPVKKINYMGITSTVTREKSVEASPMLDAATLVIGAVSGTYVHNVSGTKWGEKVKYYLRIDYLNEESRGETVFFENVNQQTEKMIGKLQELLK